MPMKLDLAKGSDFNWLHDAGMIARLAQGVRLKCSPHSAVNVFPRKLEPAVTSWDWGLAHP